jgi:hypothetical protein
MKALIFTPMVLILALITPAWAAAAVGTHEDILVKALIANAAGECPASLMAKDIKADCDQQLPLFKETLIKLGQLKATNFQGMRALKAALQKSIKVTFEHGDMTWIINTQDDGKILVLWAPNKPNWDIGSFSRSTAVSEH